MLLLVPVHQKQQLAKTYQPNKKTANNLLSTSWIYSTRLKTINMSQCSSGFPTPPTVSTDPSHIILEGDQVNLTCRSDAYPPATYSWFKRNLTLHHYLPELIIQSVQSSHSGEYSCSAENLLGESTRSILIDVKCKNLNTCHI